MARSKNIAAAEKKALESKNESQDSQFILDQYKTVYGIGVTSSSPPRPESASSRHNSRSSKSRHESPSTVFSDPPSRATSLPISKVVPSTAPPATGTETALPQQNFIRGRQTSVALVAVDATGSEGQDRGPDPRTTSACSAAIEHSDAANFHKPALPSKSHDDTLNVQFDIVSAPCALDETSWPQEKVNAPPRRVRPRSRKKAKIDMSQQSPTQENDERDYENYVEGPSFVPTSPISQDPPTEDHAIHDDDSGAVLFGNLSHLAAQGDTQVDTQVEEEQSSMPDDPGLTTGRGAWRRSSSQQHSSVQRTDVDSPGLLATQPPQTPANPQNPFAGMKKLGDPALVGSQLFGQTQFSSAVKRFSPTSSRPSPRGYTHNSISPNIAETSPLKNRYNVTSPPVALSSSPQAVRIEPRPVDDRERSPSNSGPPEDGTVPESPQLAPARTRARPEPLDIYENTLEYQKGKPGMEVEPDVSGEDSDDAADALRRRRRLAALKKEAASRELTNISVGRRNNRRPVEVPSTTKKPRERRPRRLRAHPIDDDSNASEGEFTVADSQGQAGTKHAIRGPSPDLDERVGSRPGLVSSNEAVPDSTGATQRSLPNGVVPGNESSGNSSRPKDVIPETSPNNTQDRAAVNIRASSDEPLVPPREAIKDSEGPTTTETRDPDTDTVDVDAEVSPNLTAAAPAQPSRRSGRKPRPTLKAKDLKNPGRATKCSEIVDSEGICASDAKELDKKLKGTQAKPAQEGTISSKEVPTVEEEPPLPSSPPEPETNAKETKESPFSTRNQDGSPTEPVAEKTLRGAEPPGSTSTLSVLTTTPVPSDKTSPATQESVELPHLSPNKSTRGRPATKVMAKVKTGSLVTRPGTRRKSRRSLQLESVSTDELSRSPSVNGFENSVIQPPKQNVRGSRLSMLSHTSKESRGVKLFAGMAFAISFQSKKGGERPDQYEYRLGQSRDVERMIVQSGGHLLNHGFDELFEPNALKSRSTSPVSDDIEDSLLKLTPLAQSLGFTALIADGHSRKVKYMQALALGLPCISDRWVVNCVAKGAVVDWLPYLLCAGQSAFLRDAVRSRSLLPYSATEAHLPDVIENRPKMLEGSKILLVMKKSRAEDKKMPYVFLAHVLGASLTRSYSLDEAREMLKQQEGMGEPFDWVYVDEHTGSEEGLFSSAATGSKPSKKRKRAAAPAKDAAGQPPKKIRTLSNELVIQSLILGRMIEEGELEA